MILRWHGHACFEISDGAVIVTDPHDGEAIGLPTPRLTADIVLMSHDHFDHNAAQVVKGGPVIVREPHERTVKRVKIKGVESYHDEEKGAKRGKNIIFKFELDGVGMCHLGDLGHVLTDDQVSKIGEVDLLFVPVGGVFTVDAKKALEVVEKLHPKIAVPMHFRVGGLTLGISPVSNFLKILPKSRKVREVGNEIEFVAEDLPEKPEVWVFSL